MNRRYADPHLDPMRAPSSAGQHPNTSHDDRNENPQNMYESRDRMAQYRQMPRLPGQRLAAPPPPPPQAKTEWWENPLVVFGLGTLAVYALTKMTEDKSEVRTNPAPAPQAPATSVVMMPPMQAMPQTAAPAVLNQEPTVADKTAEKPKRRLSDDALKRMRARVSAQPRYKSGDKKGQFKPKRS